MDAEGKLAELKKRGQSLIMERGPHLKSVETRRQMYLMSGPFEVLLRRLKMYWEGETIR